LNSFWFANNEINASQYVVS